MAVAVNDFMEKARQSAAAEFGRRHYRWFAFLATAKRVIGTVVVVAGALVLAGGITGAVATWPAWSGWIPTIVVCLAVAAAVALLAAFGRFLWRNRWRWRRW